MVRGMLQCGDGGSGGGDSNSAGRDWSGGRNHRRSSILANYKDRPTLPLPWSSSTASPDTPPTTPNLPSPHSTHIVSWGPHESRQLSKDTEGNERGALLKKNVGRLGRWSGEMKWGATRRGWRMKRDGSVAGEGPGEGRLRVQA